jgi:hypothetical protein
MGHRDRFVRYAARLAIERQPVDQWKELALSESNPQAALNALLALARLGDKSTQEPIFKALARFPLDGLDEALKLEKLRVIEVSFIRQGRPRRNSSRWPSKLSRQYPAKSYPLNRELSQLLVWLRSPDAIEEDVADS